MTWRSFVPDQMHEWGIVGVSLFAVACVLFATYAYNPFKKFENSVIEPAGQEIGIFAPDLSCPSDWDSLATGYDPERGTQSLGCIRGNLVAYLNEQGSLVVHDIVANKFYCDNLALCTGTKDEAEALFK